MSRSSPQAVAPVDAFYEWLLCDAPAAKVERDRRRGRNAAEAERERAQVAAWCRRTLDNRAAPAHLRDLAEVMQCLVSRGSARDLAEAGVSDDEWARRERRRYEVSRRVAGDHDYRYPARYLGAEAADQSVPTSASQSMPSSQATVCGSARANGLRSSPRSKPAAIASW